MRENITDLHIHIVPDYDDGAVDLQMSLDMLQMAYDQGVRNVFCTSHGGYKMEDVEQYKAMFMTLNMCAKSMFPEMNLYMGSEVLCGEEYIEEIFYGLDIGLFLPLGCSKCVLTELYLDTTPEEAKNIVAQMLEKGWQPIIAHAERYNALFDDSTIKELIELGALIQVNLYSLNEEHNEQIKKQARYLINNKYASFIGSDAHRTNHRPPNYLSGLQYLIENCEKEYLEALCYKNANEVIL